MLKIHDIFNDSSLALQSTYSVSPEYDVFSEKNQCRLYWYRGTGEPPIRAFLNPPIVEEDLTDTVLTKEYNCALFDMANMEQEHLYKSIKNRIFSGWYTQVKEESHWEDKRMLVWLEWIQNYYDYDNTLSEGLNYEN